MHVNLTFEKFALIQCNVNFFCIVKVNCFINQQRVLITAQLIKKFADESGSRNELKGVLIALIPSLSPKSPSFSPYLPILKPVQRLHHATQAKHRTDHRHRSKTRKSNNITVKFYGQLHQYLCLLLLSCSLLRVWILFYETKK